MRLLVESDNAICFYEYRALTNQPDHALHYKNLLLDYIAIKVNELVPSILFGKPSSEFYLTRLVRDMIVAKHDAFLKAVLLAGGDTQMRFLAHLLLAAIALRQNNSLRKEANGRVCVEAAS